MPGITIGFAECPTEPGRLCNDAVSYGTKTDSSGRFSFELSRPGRYYLVGIADGIIDGFVTIELPRDSARVVRVQFRSR